MAFTYGEAGFTYGSSPRDYTYLLPHLTVKAQIVPCPGQWYGSNDIYGQIGRRYDGCPYPTETIEVRARIADSGKSTENLQLRGRIKWWNQGGDPPFVPNEEWVDTQLDIRGRILPEVQTFQTLDSRARIQKSRTTRYLDLRAYVVKAAHLQIKANIAEFISNRLLLGEFDVASTQNDELLAFFNVNSGYRTRGLDIRAFIQEAKTPRLTGIFHVANPDDVWVDTYAESRMVRPILTRAAIS